jgi:hypothetical protein
MAEEYTTAIAGKYILVPHVWSAGSDTSETVSGVQMKRTVTGTGIAFSGTDNNVQLW